MNTLTVEQNRILDEAKTEEQLRKVLVEWFHAYNIKEEQMNWYRDQIVWGFYEDEKPQYYQGRDGEHEICEPVTASMVQNLVKALEVYERERKRYRHANPEITGEFFLAGGIGDKDQNMLPEFVEIVPAYGAGWSQLYQKTDKTISLEGS